MPPSDCIRTTGPFPVRTSPALRKRPSIEAFQASQTDASHEKRRDVDAHRDADIRHPRRELAHGQERLVVALKHGRGRHTGYRGRR